MASCALDFCCPNCFSKISQINNDKGEICFFCTKCNTNFLSLCLNCLNVLTENEIAEGACPFCGAEIIDIEDEEFEELPV